ncbi:TonB, putative [Trichomonas vaginalis G3]|uniref:TonB, putative n=1 Tax=Trichomonas vaginalis (strain ATCC PRA-98 / G3) TaxID=412133 RepID=A2G1I5_TRIV3|nr:TonB, putative [Trichomonas vaginalis G3]|eukprot:XP_001301909.1 TonB [Trichomonas vaginalis G3]
MDENQTAEFIANLPNLRCHKPHRLMVFFWILICAGIVVIIAGVLQAICCPFGSCERSNNNNDKGVTEQQLNVDNSKGSDPEKPEDNVKQDLLAEPEVYKQPEQPKEQPKETPKPVVQEKPKDKLKEGLIESTYEEPKKPEPAPQPQPVQEPPKPKPEPAKPEPPKQSNPPPEPKPEPVKEAPKPEPVKEAPKPEPKKEEPKKEEKPKEKSKKKDGEDSSDYSSYSYRYYSSDSK